MTDAVHSADKITEENAVDTKPKTRAPGKNPKYADYFTIVGNNDDKIGIYQIRRDSRFSSRYRGPSLALSRLNDTIKYNLRHPD